MRFPPLLRGRESHVFKVRKVHIFLLVHPDIVNLHTRFGKGRINGPTEVSTHGHIEDHKEVLIEGQAGIAPQFWFSAW